MIVLKTACGYLLQCLLFKGVWNAFIAHDCIVRGKCTSVQTEPPEIPVVVLSYSV